MPVSFSNFIKNSAGIRRIGSAAVDLAYTACGRFDGFWEFDLKPWDIIPGILLVQEAGGVATDNLGKYDYWETGNIVTANKHIHNQMIEFLNK
ncbi:MAG: inositol monophosphatase family protein [Candidatus Sericytochromatia bacterium]